MKPKCVPDLNSKLFEEIAILPEKRQEQIKTNVTICNTTTKHLNYQTKDFGKKMIYQIENITPKK